MSAIIIKSQAYQDLLDHFLFLSDESEKYLVFYRPQKTGIEIIRVIHGSRDIDALFEES